MNRSGASRMWPYVWAILIVASCIVVLRLVPAIDNAGAAPALLLSVLIAARTWGTGPALLASVSATVGYSYFFLPPFGIGFENPNDWTALVTFSVCAIVVGELAARAERRHIEAQEGRREIERLYRELQAAFDRASEAEAARRNEQLKAALLDALTHNLRTPLTAIKASVTALLEARHWNEQDRLSSEGRDELLHVIDEESDRLNRYIEGLSAADQPEISGPVSFRAVPLDEIVHAGLTRAETITRDHQLQVDLDQSLPALSVDAAAAAEVIYILLDNASKYAAAGTKIRVSGSIESARYARISVVDDGPGIPVPLRERVFEKFFRVPERDPADSRRARGIGLGLPIARRLVEAQGGRIWVETPASGRGTAVILTLPFSEEMRTADRAADTVAASA